MDGGATAPKGLGKQLREVRKYQGLSLQAVAEPATISAAYLQKLERGIVREPSPHVLYRLSEALKVPYSDLMRLAGYVVPRQTGTSAVEGVNLLSHALSRREFEGLSAEEAEELARYLRWYRHDRETGAS